MPLPIFLNNTLVYFIKVLFFSMQRSIYGKLLRLAILIQLYILLMFIISPYNFYFSIIYISFFIKILALLG